MLTPDIGIADEFLSLFQYDLITIQTLQDDKTQGGGVQTITGKLADHQRLVSALTKRNNKRGGIFFMVNEGDGQAHAPNKTCRAEASVITLKALFADTDGQSIDPLRKFCIDNAFEPHIITESSPGRYHFYWLLEPIDASDTNKYKFRSCQSAIANIGNYDTSMKDIARVLRIAGFYHNKKDPFMVRFILKDTERPLYDLHAIYADLKALSIINEERHPYQEPTAPLTEGQRHAELNAFIGHILNDEGISNAIANGSATGQEAALKAAIGHIVLLGDKFPEGKAWLPGGTRHSELLKQVSDFVERRRIELLPTLPQATIAPMPPAPINSSEYDPNLFLQAPGLIGKVARDFNSRVSIKIPQFEYAAARSLVGFLKSFNYITDEPEPLPAIDYCFCLAPTGRGKSFTKNLVEGILVKLGFSSYIIQNIRSDKGLDRALAEQHGRVLFVHNEAHHFLEQMRESKNDYIRAVNQWILSLYDAYKASIATTGMTADARIIQYNHANSHVGYLGYGVPVALDTIFDLKSLNNGMLTRFLIFIARNVPIPPLREYNNNPPPTVDSLPCFQMLKDMAEASGELLQAKIDLLTEIQASEASEDDDEDNERTRKRKVDREIALLKLSQGSPRKIIRTPYTPEAWAERQRFHDSLTKLRNRSELFNAFYSRTEEHIIRATLADADNGIIEKKHVQFAIQSIMALTDNLKAETDSSLNFGSFGQLQTRLSQYIKEAQRECPQEPVSYNTLIKRVSSKERYEAQDALKAMVEDGEVVQINNYTSPITGRKTKRCYRILT